jgi:cytochrome c oxidase assembly protein subunit 15
MSVVLSEPPGFPRWLHRWAVLTVGATLVLLALGALVTTRSAGMADPVWPTYPWHLLLISWDEPRPGFLIEHSHRLAGYVVGCCTIVLAVGLWKQERRWLRWLGVVALGGVIVQGLLGGFRVKLDEWLGTDLAFIHGCFASVVFSLLAGLALFTSRAWAVGDIPPVEVAAALRIRRWALATVSLVFMQLVLGALWRHTFSSLAQRGHMLIAFAVVGGVAWLLREIYAAPVRDRRLMTNAAVLALFVVGQLLLGVEALMLKYTFSSAGTQVLVRTAHVLTGHLILATAVVLTLQAYRRTASPNRPAAVPLRRLEGAA